MKTILIALLLGANSFGAIPAPSNEKIHFEIFTPNSSLVSVAQPLQVLNLEQARPELYEVTVRYFTDKAEKFSDNTFWRTAYVAKFSREKLTSWLQCVYFDPESHTCASLLGINLKPLKSKENELRAELVANYELALEKKSLKGDLYVNGNRYEGPMAYGQLLNEVNPLLPKANQLVGLGKYETTKMYVIGNDKGLGKRDIALEREFFKWVPNLRLEALSPDSSGGKAILKEVGAVGLPTYVFDKDSKNNVSVQKLAVAGRIKIKNAGYGIFDLKSGTTEVRLGTKEIPNQLDLWVMSQCPYGVKAENAFLAAKAQSLVIDNVKVNVRFIVREQKVDGKNQWASLHGDPELQEDIRQAAIQKTWPDKFWKYVEARNAAYKTTDWQSAATTAGLNPSDIESKMALGKKLIAEDMKAGVQLAIASSPTYLWQNRYVLNTAEEMIPTVGYNPEAMKTPAKATSVPGDKREPTATPKPETASAPAGGKCG